MTSCENCGKDTQATRPDDPEVMAVVVCGEECAKELAPLPAGYGFIFGSTKTPMDRDKELGAA